MNLAQVGQGWMTTIDNPLVIPDDVVESVDVGADTLTLTAHGLLSGDGPIRMTSDGTLPGGLGSGVDYWIIRFDANKIKLATTLANAVAASPVAIDVTSVGVGTHTLVDTEDTLRAGQELKYVLGGRRRVSLQIQLFAEAVSTVASAHAKLDDLIERSRLPTIRDALRAAGVSILQFGPVQAIGTVMNRTSIDPRATLTVTLLLPSEVIENGSFIEFVEIEATVS